METELIRVLYGRECCSGMCSTAAPTKSVVRHFQSHIRRNSTQLLTIQNNASRAFMLQFIFRTTIRSALQHPPPPKMEVIVWIIAQIACLDGDHVEAKYH